MKDSYSAVVVYDSNRIDAVPVRHYVGNITSSTGDHVIVSIHDNYDAAAKAAADYYHWMK